MQSERLYYDDSYLTIFESDVLEQTRHENRPALILAQSAFYPTSGGQPHDRGTLNDVPVIDVVADNGQVLHVLDAPLEVSRVAGKVDWARRFDHMVHHTGQHILTRAFINIAQAETVSFHLSEGSVTIDLDKNGLRPDDIDAAEDLANQIVAENRPVRAWFPSPQELEAINLRKVSEKVTGAVRVVNVGDFDVTGCGGTHVANTGEIGLIKVIRVDKRADKLRVEFRCGQRALEDYRLKNHLLNDLSASLTTGITDIPTNIEKLREENKVLNRALRSTREALMGYEAEAFWQQASESAAGGMVIVKHVLDDADKSDLQRLASTLAEKPQTLVMVGLYGEQAHLVFARAEDVDVDVVPLLKTALATLNSNRGGGRPTMAQGGGVPATKAEVQAALDAAYASLQS